MNVLESALHCHSLQTLIQGHKVYMESFLLDSYICSLLAWYEAAQGLRHLYQNQVDNGSIGRFGNTRYTP